MPLQAGWYGNKELAAYRANCDLVERMRMCQRARGCATVNAPTIAQLQAAVGAGRLELMEECEVASALQEDRRWCLSVRSCRNRCSPRSHVSANGQPEGATGDGKPGAVHVLML